MTMTKLNELLISCAERLESSSEEMMERAQYAERNTWKAELDHAQRLQNDAHVLRAASTVLKYRGFVE